MHYRRNNIYSLYGDSGEAHRAIYINGVGGEIYGPVNPNDKPTLEQTIWHIIFPLDPTGLNYFVENNRAIVQQLAEARSWVLTTANSLGNKLGDVVGGVTDTIKYLPWIIGIALTGAIIYVVKTR